MLKISNKKKLIVIDGLDGSGKSTQFEYITNYFNNQNIPLKSISFPDYDMPSSTLVKMYLNGVFSNNNSDVNAYAASSFYAVDRFSSYKLFWEKDYLNGLLILASRYVSSNAIHQMAKLNPEEWDDYLEWLEDYEYDKLGLPRASRIIFLDVDVDIAQKLLTKRYNGDETKKDIHEIDIEYQKRCRKAAYYAGAKLNWDIIKCYENSELCEIPIIAEKIIKIINEVL